MALLDTASWWRSVRQLWSKGRKYHWLSCHFYCRTAWSG